MTQFEQTLIDKGYVKHIFNCKTMQLEIAKGHTLSSMVNLDHRYIRPDIEGEICFGLNERDKPPTLIYPRPRIEVTREGKVLNEASDDAMNAVLTAFSPEEVIEAIYDKSIILKTT